MFSFDETNTFCISLYSNKIRWEKMVRRFEVLDMNVSRFKASTEDDLSGVFANFLNIGQKCCAHSHIKLWERILTEELDYALIIEDDACFDVKWKEKINNLSSTIQYDWDAIFLNCSEPIDPTFSWTTIREQYLTGGYIISRRGIGKLLDEFSHCYHASDWMTSRLQGWGKCYSYFPWLIIQDGSDSTIGSNSFEDHNKVVRCLNKIDYSIEDNYIV